MKQLNSFRAGPDEAGHFGIFGGRYVARNRQIPGLLQGARAMPDWLRVPALDPVADLLHPGFAPNAVKEAQQRNRAPLIGPPQPLG
jgi:hypothetical protein